MRKRLPGFSVLPHEARYDVTLPVECKIMYSEIATISNCSGKCKAKNSYFAKLFNVSPRTVQRWLYTLRHLGYIAIDVRDHNKREILPVK